MSRVKAVWERRSLLWHLVKRYLKKRYEGAALGYLWSLLEPALLTAVYFFVFSLVGRFGVDDYALFIIVAMLPWLWFSSAANASARSLLNERRLITTVYVPREIFPLALAMGKGVEFAMSLPVLVIVALVLEHPPTVYLLLLPLAMLIQWMLVSGISLGLASLNTLYGDVERILRVVLRALFYMTPIVYPFDRIPVEGLARGLELANPLIGLTRTYRSGWFAESFPGWFILGWTAIYALIVLVLGWWLFTRLEPKVLKEL